MSALDLRPDVEGGGAGRMGARPRIAPGQRMEAVTDRDLHQLVPGRMKIDLVDAVAEPVVSAQPRGVGVGLETPSDRLFGAGQRTQLADEVLSPRSALALERLAQRAVGVEQVVAGEWWGLVQDLGDGCSTSWASSATMCSWRMRSSVSPAIGETMSVSTPASR